VRCRLENHNGIHPDVVAVPGGLAFRLGGRGVDTSDAWYKLDDQPARPWRDLRAELVAAGSLAEAERLDNPSGGWVLIPLQEARGAARASILLKRGAHPKIFKLNGFWPLLVNTDEMGCRLRSMSILES
jgi:hypothetical protein